MRRLISVLCLVVFCMAGAAKAQTLPPNPAGVAMGHLHYNVRNMEASRTFWIALGAKPVMMGAREVLKFPGVLVFLTQAESSGGTEGSVVNHVAFRVPSVPRSLAKMKAAGYKVQEGTAGTGKVGNVWNPEDERIELMEDQSVNVKFAPDKGPYVEPAKMTVPITLHHIHFYVPANSVGEIKAWYVKMFGAIPGKRFKTAPDPPYEAADLPGVNLNVAEAHGHLAPLKGRRLDHIGFEIKNLEAFCRKLEASGIKLDAPYRKLPSGIAHAYLTDPWGVYIELTEGLDRL
jgi:catechol 2,3-dioxygenase-like lactoylglutathione lyase family enzyme